MNAPSPAPSRHDPTDRQRPPRGAGPGARRRRSASALASIALVSASLSLAACGAARQGGPGTPGRSQLGRWVAAQEEHRLLLVEAVYVRQGAELSLEIRRVAEVAGDLAPSIVGAGPRDEPAGRAELLDDSGRRLVSLRYAAGGLPPPMGLDGPAKAVVQDAGSVVREEALRLRLRLPAPPTARRVRLVEPDRGLRAEAAIQR